MNRARARESDNGNNEYKSRSTYEKYKVIIVLIGALSGGSIAGIGVKFYNTNEVNATPARVELLEERMSSYVESHAREEILSDQLLRQILANIKEDLGELKEENLKVHRKLDNLTNLIRNGRPTR